MEDMAYTLFGIAYIPFLLSFAVMTRNLERGISYIWLIPIGAAITDIFAYFTGVTLGKTKIIPHISPKKTVEGSIGGAIGCMLTMVLYGVVFMNNGEIPAIPLHHFAIMGLLCGVVSQLGDWAASSIKRSTGIKDFGRLIPGHGGIMDRADSILFVAPLIYIYVTLFL
jgi:phosphatidate cytidylyltransferase